MTIVTAIATLPAIFHKVLPEMQTLPLAEERRIDCANCPLIDEHFQDSSDPAKFNPSTRCCTHRPRIPNFMVGRALLESDAGSDRIRERIKDKQGLLPWGICPPEWWEVRTNGKLGWFGKEQDLLCPYYVDGPKSCSIWMNRNAACRCWYCRHNDGAGGQDLWRELRDVLTLVEHLVAVYLSNLGDPPEESADVDDWVAWFTWCAGAVEKVAADDIVSDKRLVAAREQLSEVAASSVREIPDVVVPNMTHCSYESGRLKLIGYSVYDVTTVDPSIVYFFEKLGGSRPWREALAETIAEHGDIVDDQLVRALYRYDILRSPEAARELLSGFVEKSADHGASPILPEVLVPSVQRPLAVDGKFALQGEVPLDVVFAPQSICRFFGYLDGDLPWRDALIAAKDDGIDDVDVELVERLFRIGALRAPRGHESSSPE